MATLYSDRSEAGRVLAERLRGYAGRDDVIVLGLPRGGVVVAFDIAIELGAPLDVFLVRKLGVPEQPELAMGAIASGPGGGVRVLNERVVRALRIPPEVIDEVARREMQELRRRDRLYRGERPPLDLHDRVVILVDDGLATGATMRAAIDAIRVQHPVRLVATVPVAAADVCEQLGREVDEMVCAATPDLFFSVGSWYEDFSETSDEEVRELLALADREWHARRMHGAHG